MSRKTSVGIESVMNVTLLDTIDLIPFELQEKYDADGPSDDFVDKIKKDGLTEPIVVTGDGIVISGWRRTQAFRILKKKKIPAIVRKDLNTHGRQLLAWTSANEHRDQTTAQKVVRYQAYSDAYKEIANESVKTKEKSNLPTGSSKGAAAKKSGLGARQTAERASIVVEYAAELSANGMSTLADELLDLLNNKSINAAYKRTLEVKEELAGKDKTAKKKNHPAKPNHRGFDERKIHEITGKMVRILLERAKLCKNGQKNEGYRIVDKNLNELLESIAAWRKSDPL